jgi:hypothetical protein
MLIFQKILWHLSKKYRIKKWQELKDEYTKILLKWEEEDKVDLD